MCIYNISTLVRTLWYLPRIYLNSVKSFENKWAQPTVYWLLRKNDTVCSVLNDLGFNWEQSLYHNYCKSGLLLGMSVQKRMGDYLRKLGICVIAFASSSR